MRQGLGLRHHQQRNGQGSLRLLRLKLDCNSDCAIVTGLGGQAELRWGFAAKAANCRGTKTKHKREREKDLVHE